MTKAKLYEALRPTKVAWLPAIPSHWETARGRHIFRIQKRIAGKLGFDVLSVTQGGIKLKDTTSGEGQLSQDYSKYQLVYAGDFVMNHMDLLTGWVDRSSFDGVTSPDYRVFELTNDECDPEFFRLACQVGYIEKLFYAYGQGVSHLGRWRFPADNFKNFVFPKPPLPEQQAAAKAVGRETARIEALIEKKSRFIELLKEKQQSLINQAVTKGLKHDVEMQDSEVEWIGKTPAHWTVKQYRYATRVFRGKFSHRPRNDPRLYEGKFPFIQTGDVAQSEKYITHYKQTLNEKGAAISAKFPKGTLVMAIAANVGDTAILNFEAYCPDSIVGFQPYDGVNIEFLRYSFIASIDALRSTATQSTQANLNIERISAVKAAFPSPEEQHEIVQFLTERIERYELLASKVESSILLLQQRRSALITAAVTGQIDLREDAA